METRNKPREQDPKERAHNFEEVTLGFDDETALKEAKRCLGCKNPKCVQGCPVKVNIPSFIRCIIEGDLESAIKVINETSNLPAVCGRVCPQENQCEKLCVRNNERMGGAVAIGALERYVADYGLAHQIKANVSLQKNGKKIAVIGSGPSGLTCAADLAMAGCDVTIYEAFHQPGGVLIYGIPEFRLPKRLVQTEIDKLKELGVNIVLNTVIGKTITMDELLEEFDAVFIGSGAGLPMFMNIKGETLCGVYSANEYLTRINLMKAYLPESATPVQVGKKVVVVGAGNVAMDAARTALRMGADKVIVVYRRSRDEMPARREEVHHAEQEGVEFHFLTNPVEIIGKGKVEAIKLIRMELGEPDASGRRRPIEVAGSEYEMDCDQVIVALGTSPNPLIKNSCPALETTKKGTLIVNEQNQTTLENVYAGGDAVTGAATVILAMGAGKGAASEILKKLGIRTK